MLASVIHSKQSWVTLRSLLYVLKGSLSTYRSADVLENFFEIQEFDTTDINDVAVSDELAFEQVGDGVKLTNANGKAVVIY